MLSKRECVCVCVCVWLSMTQCSRGQCSLL